MLEQFERAKRYLIKMENLYAGIFSSSGHDKEAYDDDVVSFFIHCYHIRDWLIHLNKSGITKQQVDLYINKYQALKICSDLANGSKHYKLTRSLRTNSQPYISGTGVSSIWHTGNGGGEVMRCIYTISSNAEFFDALELAKECIQLWGSFINELTIMKDQHCPGK
jgi:hypothetical protein